MSTRSVRRHAAKLQLGKFMEIKKIAENKEEYMDLLLLGDEKEDMIKKYLYRGELFALFDEDLKTVCAVTEEGNGFIEIKNIATYEKYHGKGYGKTMIKYIIEEYKDKCKTLLVGTGDVEKALNFYKSLGFKYSHVIKNFFMDNYDHKMIEDGIELRDMVYLRMDF
jgi:ribosomal protein S18 acetylase RimI-like enzyme